MSEDKNQKHGWYRAARVFGWIMTHFLTPVKFMHTERIIENPPYILVANHLSWMDPVICASIIKKHEVTFLGKKELTKNRLVKHVLEGLHMIIVDRHHADMEAMRACMRTLKNGEILGIFPEGTRHHNGIMEETETGVAMIALRGNVPLLPMYVESKPKFFRKIHCYIGEPISLADIREKGINTETCKEVMERLRIVYADLAEKCKIEKNM